ncbi:MAG: aminotransferase class IV [Pseudomonadota bacterium]
MITTLWLNGEFVTKDKPLIHHDDSGFLRANGVFDSMLAVNGMPVNAQEHYLRLMHDCEVVLRYAPDLSFDQFYETAQNLLRENGIDTDHYARIRTQVTGGILKEFLGKPDNPTISMSCSRTRTPDNQEHIIEIVGLSGLPKNSFKIPPVTCVRMRA